MNNIKTFFTAKVNIGENIANFNSAQLKIARRLSFLVLLLLVTGFYLLLSSTHALATFMGGYYVVAYLVAIVLMVTFSKNGRSFSLIPFLPDYVRKVLVSVLALYGQVIALMLAPGSGYSGGHWVLLVWALAILTLRYNIVKLYNSFANKAILN